MADTVVSKADLKEIASELVAKHAETVARREKAFNVTGSDEDKAKLDITNKRSEFVTFMKALTENDTAVLKKYEAERVSNNKALSEGSGSAGGYLVPVEFEKEVIRFLNNHNQFRKEATVLPMNSKTLNLNTLVTEPTVYITGESSLITASDVAFGEPIITPKKYAAIQAWSSELLEDSEVDLMGLIAERFGKAISKAEQTEFISGATAGSLGVLKATGVTANTLSATGTLYSAITWDELAGMIAALDEVDLEESQNAKFIMSPSVFNVLRKQKSSTGGEYMVYNAPQEGTVAQAWGRPIVLMNQMPLLSATATGSKFVALADWKKHAFIGDRRGITVKLLEEGTVGSDNLAEKDMQALRVTKRTGFVTANATGIVTLATN